MDIEKVRASNSNLNEFFSEIEHDFSLYSNSRLDEFLNISADEYLPADNLNVLISGLQRLIKNLRENIDKFYGSTKDSANKYTEVENREYNKSKNDLSDGSSINLRSSSSSNYYDDYSDYSDYTDYSDNLINNDNSHNRIREFVVDNIILEKLALLGINKSNIGEVTSNDEYDYVITINESGENGLSKIYVKDGNIIGGLDLNNNYVEIDDEKLVLDKNNSSTMDEIAIASGSIISGSVINKSDTPSMDNDDVNSNISTNIDDKNLNDIDSGIVDESKNTTLDIINNSENSSEILDNRINSNNEINYNDNMINNEVDMSENNESITYNESSHEQSSLVENNQDNYLFNIEEAIASDIDNNLESFFSEDNND